jgi:hypothetical protein
VVLVWALYSEIIKQGKRKYDVEWNVLTGILTIEFYESQEPKYFVICANG